MLLMFLGLKEKSLLYKSQKKKLQEIGYPNIKDLYLSFVERVKK